MGNVGNIGETLSFAVQAIDEGVHDVDEGEGERAQVVSLYAGFIAAIDNLAGMTDAIGKQVESAGLFAQIGGARIHEGVQALLSTGSTNEALRTAVTRARQAANMACGPHGSLESTVEVQQDGLADIVEGLQGLRKVAEGLAALAGDTGYAEGIHMNADYAVAYTEDYAARVGVKVVTVD